MTKKIKINGVRLSYPNVFRKGFYEGKENKKYTVSLVLDKSDPEHIKAKKIIDEQISNIYNETKTERSSFKDDKFCIKEDSEEFQNSWVIKTGNPKRITIIDRDKTPLTEEDGKIYAGCYVNVVIDLYYYDKQYGKFILSNIYGIQFSKDGEPLEGGIVDVTDDFDDLEELL
jgi:hypothetical protein